MKYYLGNNVVNIFPSFLNCIGFGNEGKAFEYNGMVLKLFHKNIYIDSMNSETCVELKKIHTKRILLPNELLIDKNGDFKGYTIEKIKKTENVYDIKKAKLINEIIELQKEIDKLSEHRILIDDWHMDNFMYDGIFRMIDPGLYKYDIHDDILKIKKANYDKLKDFIIFKLLRYKLINISDNEFENSLLNFIEEQMRDEETLNQYTKRIAIKH